jgi:NADPH:quinone reductase-like Zn-dependent oxidoreductase
MKAIISNKYGGPEVLGLNDVPKPVPNDDQVLVKVHAASLNKANLILLKGKPYLVRLVFGLTKPKHPIPGCDIAGKVESVGKNVTQFKPGDEVYGDLSSSGWGGFAEYVAAPQQALAHKPANLSFEEAATVPMAGVTALQALRDKGKIQPGQSILINGASGGVGTFAVQIAKSYGANVTGVVSTRNLGILESLGADETIDYTKEDFTKGLKRYDLIGAVNGNTPIQAYKQALKPKGTCVLIGGSESQMYENMFKAPWISMTSDKKMSSFMQKVSQIDLTVLKELIEAGKVKPVIDKVFHLEDTREAFEYFIEGRALGKVVISI